METSSSENPEQPPLCADTGSADGRRARQDFACEHCGRTFTAKPVHDRRGVSPRRFCSKRCAGAHRTAAAAAVHMAEQVKPRPTREASVPQHPAELMEMALVQPLTPGQSAKVRSYIFGLLRAQIPLAHRVVMGEVEWSPTQARVFGQLLDKCVPDLTASFMVSEKDDGDLALLSRRELEALAGRDENRSPLRLRRELRAAKADAGIAP